MNREIIKRRLDSLLDYYSMENDSLECIRLKAEMNVLETILDATEEESEE